MTEVVPPGGRYAVAYRPPVRIPLTEQVERVWHG